MRSWKRLGKAGGLGAVAFFTIKGLVWLAVLAGGLGAWDAV